MPYYLRRLTIQPGLATPEEAIPAYLEADLHVTADTAAPELGAAFGNMIVTIRMSETTVPFPELPAEDLQLWLVELLRARLRPEQK
ncbi:hypothetical protein [Gluconacetobacter diazotrophicus]|uniref:hypothetical protein n=1 Tax=Gluconacetobacter diazotrophicus TaxID=33996 RepID=UPI00059CC357|nr:hypothetical protein [Gluconacetobacter diazotrophicus]